MTSSFTLALRGVSAELLVLAIRGKEELGQLYRFEVRVAAADDLAAEAVLGMPAELQLTVGSTTRHVTGIVTAHEVVSRRSDGRQVLRLRVEPRLAALKHRSHWRVFHDRAVEEVLAEVLGAVGASFAWRVSREVGKKPHRCQRGERDLAFVQRMLAEEALVSWFEEGEDGVEVLVVSDRVESYPRLPCEVLRHVGLDPSLASSEATVFGMVRNVRLRPRGQTVRRFDWRRPVQSLESRSAGYHVNPELALEEHEHASEGLAPSPFAADARLLEARARADRAHGGCLTPEVCPGRTFQLTEHSEAALNRRFVLVSVEHEGRAPRDGEGGDLDLTYRATIHCAPAEVLVLPERQREPTARGLETATVMGPEHDEVHTDDEGRIQIRFHWDTRTPAHPPVTAWVRVSQPWGGAGYGATFTPRVGNEVLVGYIDGDGDKPIVVGSVYNGLQRAVQRFPHERTRNGFATRSSPDGGGGHLLMFEDRRGEELLEIRSCRALTMSSETDSVVTTGARLDLTVGGARRDEVALDYSAKIGGNEHCEVGAQRVTRVAGADRLHVGANCERDVAGSVIEKVAGSVITLVQGSRSSIVGARPGLACDESLTVSGHYHVGAAGGVRLQSPAGIEILCGKSRLSILPDRILLESPVVQLQATDAIRLVQGPSDGETASSLVLEGAASLSGGTATVASGQGGILVLDADAKLNGALVKLNCDAADAGGAEKIVDPTKVGVATFKVLPDRFPPGTTTVTLVVQSPSGELLERECAVGGTVTFEGHPGERFTLVEMRVGATALPYAERPLVTLPEKK